MTGVRQYINQNQETYMKDSKKLSHHQDSNSQHEENSKMHHLSDSMEIVEKNTGTSTEPMEDRLGGGEKDSSGNLAQSKLQEEHSLSFSIINNSAPGPGPSGSPNQDKSIEDLSRRKSFPSRIQGESKKIIKKKNVFGKRATKKKERIPGQRLISRTDPVRELRADPVREISGRENHRKYTVKKVSNFLRKELKKLKCDFSLLQAKNNNKRGSRIYFNVALLELKYRLTSRFPEFINSYLRECDRQIAEYVSQQDSYGWTERNERYIEDFNRAKDSAIAFLGGEYFVSIRSFFGTGRERRYLNVSIQYFIQCVKTLEEGHVNDVLTL